MGNSRRHPPPPTVAGLKRLPDGRGVVALALVWAFVSACSSGRPVASGSTDLVDKIFPVQSQVSATLAAASPTSVAVLPFTQVRGETSGAEVVRRSVYNHLSSKKFKDVELYRVDATLRSGGFASAADLGAASPQALAQLLGVEAVIYGEVIDYSRTSLGVYSQVAVGLKLRMLDGQSGQVLWEAEHTSRSHGGGPALDPIGVVMQVIGAALNMQQVQLLRGTDDVSRKLVATLPGPTLSEAFAPPRIQALAQDSGGIPRKIGEVIEVVMVGDPGHVAHFHIGAFKQDLPMLEQEESKGTYVGSYQVLPGDQVQAALLEGTLTDERGNQSRWVDALGLVTLDTQAPATPTGLTTVGREAAIVLGWQPNTEPDLVGYQLYRSDSPLTGYRMLDQAEETTARDTELINFQHYYYKVAAVDRAGNASPLSDATRGIPVKPGPTPVTADITDDTTWYTGASPYVLEQPITVRADVTLTVEPGVTVESGGPGVRVRGSLLAVGQPEAPIVFRGRQGMEASQRWDGLTFDNTGTRENRLAHTKIQDARVALRTISASPTIQEALFIKNDTALLVEEGSEPHLDKNTITNNRQDGIVIRHATPTLIHNEISHNTGNGITLLASAPVVTENNIHSNTDRQLAIEEGGAAIVNVQNNWWGTTNREQLAQFIVGPASYARILDGPYPAGQAVALPPRKVATSPPVEEVSTPLELSDTEVDALIAEGDAAYKQGRLREALGSFTQALAVRQDDHQLHFQVGLIHYRLGEHDETLTVMQRAITLHPDHPGYRYHLGLVYSELGMAKQAVGEWQRVLALEPHHHNAKMLLELEQHNSSE